MFDITINGDVVASAVMNNNFKYGYRMVFTSWENDVDEYQDNVIHGIEHINIVHFLVSVAGLFRPDSVFTNTKFDRRIFDEIDKLIKQYDVIPETKSYFDEFRADVMDDDDNAFMLREFLFENILGYAVNYGGSHIRVVERIKVDLLQPMVVQILNKRN